MSADAVNADVIIVGGGLIGLASAWQAAQAGLEAVVVDPAPGRGASDVAAGMLAPVTEVARGEEDHLALNIAAARRWPAFAAALTASTGVDVGYRPTGTLLVGFDQDDVSALADLHAYQRELGLDVERLHSRQARSREPMLSPRVRGGLFAAEDHRVEPRRVIAALLQAAAEAGVRVHHARVARIERAGDRVAGATTVDGMVLHAERVVLAAGAWSATIDGLAPRTQPPIRPVKGQLLHLRGSDGEQVLTTTVRALVRHRSVYLVPRDDGRLVVGASQEERGFDTTVTAGVTRELLDDAVAVVPGIDELELVETIAGLRPTTPDNAPVIGRGRLDGLVLATGHHRNGALLTPITAEAVAALLLGEDPDPVIGAAALERPGLLGMLGRRDTPTTSESGAPVVAGNDVGGAR